MTVDWRLHDTEQARREFADAQYRLDDLDYGEQVPGFPAGTVYTPKMAAADEKIADRYDRLVLQPAHDEYERDVERAEFEHHYPEPPDETVVEWECGGRWYAARRQDQPEIEGGAWWLYGDAGPRTWRQLVVEFELRMDDLHYLVPQEAR